MARLVQLIATVTRRLAVSLFTSFYRPGAWQIKRMLTEDRVSATSAIARFVGIEAYEAAGGKIDRDLFAEEDERGIWFDDPDLLNKLAMDSLQVAARELETRWKWAEILIS